LGYTCPVSSPTFAIVNEYRGGRLDLAHFDVYRIADENELYGTGFYDYLDGGFVIFMEWSENVPFAIEDDAIILTIEHGEGDCRRITVEAERELEF
ncbi:MAG: tRNA (adenosine(37)-N6)-threonylcarbamoyltransferase complex ATPase subunit type 1 TsaE, partial [Oscillospiraceae bacterium]|nr:tRNA (adenosine(37)-N6)-threonylcarbamoyltransferase complex ATPase subunit type 1 TsaE [Oscillospiraceae bacterium]